MITSHSSFDETTYTQSTFRSLLDCMARPGKLSNINPAEIDVRGRLNEYVSGIAITVLDKEVTFHIVNDVQDNSATLRAYTMAKSASVESCDFLFVHGSDAVNVTRLKRGSLTFPDESATVVCQVCRLSEFPIPDPSLRSTLTGPGIQSSCSLYIEGLNVNIITQWQESNREYPLGLDWILVDEWGNVTCIPRTTTFTWEVD